MAQPVVEVQVSRRIRSKSTKEGEAKHGLRQKEKRAGK